MRIITSEILKAKEEEMLIELGQLTLALHRWEKIALEKRIKSNDVLIASSGSQPLIGIIGNLDTYGSFLSIEAKTKISMKLLSLDTNSFIDML